MTTTLTNFIHRLQLERGYALLADADEDRMKLPDEDRWEKALREAGEQGDEAKASEVVEAYLEAVERNRKTWQPVGGPFPCPLEEDGTNAMDLFAAPALLELKRHFSRILVKRTPMALKVVLIAENQVDDSVSRERLPEVGKRLQAEFAIESDTPAKRSPLLGKRRKSRPSVLFDVMVLGDRVIHPQQRHRLKRLKVGWNPRNSIFVHCHLLDTSSKRLWSTLSRLLWGQRRALTYALKHTHETAPRIRQQIASARVNLGLVAFTVVLALVLVIGGHIALWHMVPGEFLALWNIMVPLTVLGFGIAVPRLKHNIDKQVSYFLWGYLALFLGLELWLIWPPSVGHLIGPLVTGFLIYTFGQFIGTLAQLS